MLANQWSKIVWPLDALLLYENKKKKKKAEQK